jgi:hypothetical protein
VKEEGLPELFGNPRGNRTGNEQSAHDVHPHRSPVHNEQMTDRGLPLFGEHPLPNRTLMNGHFHGSMAFYAPL